MTDQHQLLANRRRSRRLAPINHLTGVTRKKNAPETE